MDGERPGSCRCGRVRFAVSGAPLVTMACHCTGCQKMTAGPYSLSALYSADAFRLTEGETAIGGLHGEHRHHHCAYCMSWLYTQAKGLEAFVNVRTPMLEGAADLPPFVETCTAERLPFAATGAEHCFERFPDMADFPALLEAYASRTALRGV
jgi:hypothetical protein